MTRVRTSLSLLVAIVLVVLVLQNVGMGELAAALRGANVRFIIVAFIVGHVTFLPKVVNWQQLLRAQGHDLRFLPLFRWYLVGVFFNNMFPTNVGGDVVRSYEVGRRINDPATALATVFVERLTGLVVLVAIAAIAVLANLDRIDSPVLTLAVAAACVGLPGITWVAFTPTLLARLSRGSPEVLARQLRRFTKFQAALHRYRGHRRLFVNSFVLSLAFNALAILYVYVSVCAFQDSVSLPGVLFVVPITMVVGMMPFAFNGVGLQEWACVLLFPSIGVSASVALSAMLLVRGITLFTSLIGGLLYVQMTAQRRRDGAVVTMETSSVRPG